MKVSFVLKEIFVDTRTDRYIVYIYIYLNQIICIIYFCCVKGSPILFMILINDILDKKKKTPSHLCQLY